MLTLDQIKGVGSATLKKFEELDIKSVFELYSFLPTKYIDLQSPQSINDAQAGQLGLFEGRAEKVSAVSPRGKRSFHINFADNLCKNRPLHFKVTFYNMPFLHDGFNVGDSYRIFGRLTSDVGAFEIVNPQIEKIEKITKLRDIYTVYPLKGIIGQNAYKKILDNALDSLENAYYDGRFARVNSDMSQIFLNIHRPKDVKTAVAAREELAVIDMAITLALYKKQRKIGNNSRKVLYNLTNFRIDNYISALPYEPTPSQFFAFEDILRSLRGNKREARIISGDVGSGKTAVAFFAMAACAFSANQAALMVPTEILAKQHCEKFRSIADKLGISFALLTSSTRESEKKIILSGLADGSLNCVIGTQSVISENVKFKKLTLALIDEQHKFGVNERRALEAKGATDVISLTATPIPRSMALTFYDDIDISVIEKRKEAASNIKTSIVDTAEEGANRVAELCGRGKQAFIVCPSIVDAEGYDLNSIESFVRDYISCFDGLKVGVLHGKMKECEKSEVMRAFSAGEISVLIATTVVEVGVDTRASEILILNADRFGLASLHQLRGRVGRDGSEAHCFVHCSNASEKAARRLEIFCEHNDGQYLAEADFELRGAGDFLGTKQSGASLTPIFGLAVNADTLKKAKKYADEVLGGFSVSELSALTRHSKTRVEKFLSDIDKVTLNS